MLVPMSKCVRACVCVCVCVCVPAHMTRHVPNVMVSVCLCVMELPPFPPGPGPYSGTPFSEYYGIFRQYYGTFRNIPANITENIPEQCAHNLGCKLHSCTQVDSNECHHVGTYQHTLRPHVGP